LGRVRVKICGVTRPADALHAARAGADAIGMIFADSPRRITPEQAAEITGVLPPWVTAVGVFVNAELSVIIDTVHAARLTAVQLHGDESPEQMIEVARQVAVLKAFRVAGPTDIDAALEWLTRGRPNGCLVDSRVEGVYGGTGHTAPWDLVATHRDALWPLVLGGGLTPENVAEAIGIVQPFGVEASSGVEAGEPGRKDPERVRRFIEMARGTTIRYPDSGENE
jgi:phosphoribosylanthranilate isomerase